jgi:hypothetical protein
MSTFHSSAMPVSTETLAIFRSAGPSKDDPGTGESTQREDFFLAAPRWRIPIGGYRRQMPAWRARLKCCVVVELKAHAFHLRAFMLKA